MLPDDECERIARLTPYAHLDWQLPDGGLNWREVARKLGSPANGGDGMWLNEQGLRALAIALQTHILVLPPAGTLSLYPKMPARHGWAEDTRTRTDDPIQLQCAARHGLRFLPDVAFSRDTIVICYNGTNHFWCTALDPPLGQSVDEFLRACRAACPLPVHHLVLL
jgi:hypothetical protein